MGQPPHSCQQLKDAIDAQIYDSIIEGENLERIATNFDAIDNPVLL